MAGSNNALGKTAKLTVQPGGALVSPAVGGVRPSRDRLPVSIAGNGPTGAGAIEKPAGQLGERHDPLSSPGTIGSDAGTLTLKGAINIGSGPLTFTGAGDINVNGQLFSKVAGLLEGQANANDGTTPIDPRFGTDIQLGTTMAQTNSVTDVTDAFPDDAAPVEQQRHLDLHRHHLLAE